MHSLLSPYKSCYNHILQALYDYTAMHSDELSFKEGDILSLLERVDKGLWWRATFRGKSGLAPANYIEVVSKSVVRRNWKDSVQDSDEWDSSEDELEVEEGNAAIIYYYNDAPRSVSVTRDIIKNPNYIALYRAIQYVHLSTMMTIPHSLFSH